MTKAAAQVAQSVARQLEAKGSAQQIGSTSQTDGVISDEGIKEVWKRMASMYAHKWTSSYGEKIDPVWRRAMQSVPLRRLQIALARCGHSHQEWPPTLPAFLAMTKVMPEEVGAPDVDIAYREACRGAHPCNTWHRWSHKCVYWAAVWTGMSDLNDRPNASRKAFDREYQKAIEQASELSDPPKAVLPHVVPDHVIEADREASNAIIERMKSGTFGEAELVYVAGRGLVKKSEAEGL